MDLQYIGVNSSSGRKEWIERELARPWRSDGMVMEEWQMERYVPFMETVLDCIGRSLQEKSMIRLLGYRDLMGVRLVVF